MVELIPDHRETGAVLLEMLTTSLRRGHWRVAIRRFLMLLACGVEVPDVCRNPCEALLLACPKRDLIRIREHVQSWVEMLQPRAAYGQRHRVPSDAFAHLHVLSRRTAHE
jgi:hypothetical protein